MRPHKQTNSYNKNRYKDGKQVNNISYVRFFVFNKFKSSGLNFSKNHMNIPKKKKRTEKNV